MPFEIRSARPDDRAALSSICLLTADSGVDGSALYSDPDYPGLVWSVPYLDFAPRHAFVLVDGDAVLGYVVGAADTVAFERRLDRDWWPALQAKYGQRQSAAPLDDVVLGRIRQPRHARADLAEAYPAHIHINLLPAAQSGGWGRRLIAAELESLRQAGVPAVHLGVSLRNERARGFYQHVGFHEIDRGDAIWMGQKL